MKYHMKCCFCIGRSIIVLELLGKKIIIFPKGFMISKLQRTARGCCLPSGFCSIDPQAHFLPILLWFTFEINLCETFNFFLLLQIFLLSTCQFFQQNL